MPSAGALSACGSYSSLAIQQGCRRHNGKTPVAGAKLGRGAAQGRHRREPPAGAVVIAGGGEDCLSLVHASAAVTQGKRESDISKKFMRANR
jgi:hypothetical protein